MDNFTLKRKPGRPKGTTGTHYPKGVKRTRVKSVKPTPETFIGPKRPRGRPKVLQIGNLTEETEKKSA